MATPEGWRFTPLGSAGNWLSGGTPSKQDPAMWDGSIPWVSPKDMKRARLSDAIDHVSAAAIGNGTQMAPAGSLLMVVRGMILAHTFPVAAVERPVTFNQDVKALVPTPEFDTSFLLYWLQDRQSEVLRLVDVANHGTKRLPSERLFALRVPTPPLPEQRKIAAILSSLDDAIEGTQAVIDQLQVVKKAMMAELLTRGLPGRHTKFKQTEIGEVPEEWDVAVLSDLAQVQTGLAKGKTVERGVELPYLRVANVQDGHVDLTELKRVEVDHGSVERYRLRAGDVLFTEGGDADKLGRGCVWYAEIDPCLHQNHIFAVRPNVARLLPEFLAAWAACEGGKAYFLGCAKQTTNLASINSTQLKALPVPVPSVQEQQGIVDRLGSVISRTKAERAGLNCLRAAKDALMSVLLTGEVRVTPDESPA